MEVELDNAYNPLKIFGRKQRERDTHYDQLIKSVSLKRSKICSDPVPSFSFSTQDMSGLPQFTKFPAFY